METVNAFSSLVSNLGVPIACLVVTFFLWYKETQTHKEEVEQLRDALVNNTLVMQKLLDRMDREDAP